MGSGRLMGRKKGDDGGRNERGPFVGFARRNLKALAGASILVRTTATLLLHHLLPSFSIHKFFYSTTLLFYSFLPQLNMDTDVNPNPETLFRPVKRRKFLRRRPEAPQDEPQADSSSPAPSQPQPQDETQASDGVHSTDIARLRRLQRARKGGIEFSATSRQAAEHASKNALSTASADEIESERIRAMCDRFTGHTGQTVDVDRHMYAQPSFCFVEAPRPLGALFICNGDRLTR